VWLPRSKNGIDEDEAQLAQIILIPCKGHRLHWRGCTLGNSTARIFPSLSRSIVGA
jgi:hypothetical protein